MLLNTGVVTVELLFKYIANYWRCYCRDIVEVLC